MTSHELAQRLAVCSWSLQPEDPHDLVGKLKTTGTHRVQVALDPLREFPGKWNPLAKLLAANGITIVSGMFGCIGEDYSTLDSIRLTGGIAPDNTWEENWKNIQVVAALAHALELKLVTFHAGFLPHRQTDKNFSKMLDRLGEVADIFERANVALGLETGQETAALLARLLKKLGRQNVGVNFDPANMILYGKGDPIEALRDLGNWICQVHLKDAKATKIPGTWGEEVAAGEGDVDWPSFFAALKELKFAGPIVIEREAGTRRIEDIRTAKKVAERTFV